MFATHSIKLLESFYNVEYTWPGVGVKKRHEFQMLHL